MFQSVKKNLQSRYRRALKWVFRNSFQRERVYIVPTWFGMLYISVLFTTFLLGMLTDHPLLHLFGFLLLTLFLVGMLQTNSNLMGISITQVDAVPAPAGTPVSITLRLVNRASDPNGMTRFGLIIQNQAEIPVLAKNSHEKITFVLPARSRGVYQLPKIRVATKFPLGLFYSWKTFAVPSELVVYPSPVSMQNARSTFNTEEEDFTQHTPYVRGESENRIDWKAYARTRELLLKQFKDIRSSAMRLDWFDLKGMDSEMRLSQMAFWLLQGRETQRPCSLTLPELRLPAANSPEHYRQCLKALAGFRGRG